MTESPQRRRRVRRIVLGSALLIHVIVYWSLGFVLRPSDDVHRVIAVGVMLGQCSLAAILATMFAPGKLARIAITWSAALTCWYGLSTVFYWGLGEPGAAWWAIAITVQTIVCSLGTQVMEQKRRHASASSAVALESGNTPFQFPIRSLIVLTTMAAIGFAVVEVGQRRGWWSIDSLNVHEGIMMVVVGLMVGVTALLCVIALAARKRSVVATRLFAFAGPVFLLAVVLQWGAVQAGMDQSSDPTLAVVLLGTQAGCVVITLGIVNRVSGAP
ncbi:hypothetical protein Enr13x_70280 [Stieleria neptunia]|uniref:Uncharacterized protein n=1 Tax=Stieleria neptunia TaxID=2527979 RepID=A0A518I1Y9_9BACT|nr:hypothetical protein [Stieleria neptunia]QDV47119.1 hypothetical protein Enr13x_70280 [Stieleria neptunia]